MLHAAQANHTGNMTDTIPFMGVPPYGFFAKIGDCGDQASNISNAIRTAYDTANAI